MPSLRRVEVTWTGLTGLPGLSVFYTDAASDVTTNLGTFFNAIKGAFPTGLSWSIPSTGDEVDVATGLLTGSWTGGTAATVAAGPNTPYAAGVGAFIRWGTPLIIGGRRLKGRTFLAPLLSSLYDASGTIDNANLGTLQSAASTLAAAGKLVTWHRPSTLAPSGGASATITSAQVPDQVTWLKTRRI